MTYAGTGNDETKGVTYGIVTKGLVIGTKKTTEKVKFHDLLSAPAAAPSRLRATQKNEEGGKRNNYEKKKESVDSSL